MTLLTLIRHQCALFLAQTINPLAPADIVLSIALRLADTERRHA